MRRIGMVCSAAACAGLWLACSAGSGGVAPGSAVQGFTSCTSDDGCPADQGCQLDTPAGDGYCSPLCTTNADCPRKYNCPDLSQEANGDCDDLGKHKGGKGACEQFDRSKGPKTCTSAVVSDSGTTVIVSDGGTSLPDAREGG